MTSYLNLDTNVLSQQELINDVRDEDSWIILILDACRYDAFVENINEDAIPVKTGGCCTREWYKSTWWGDWDNTLITASAWPLFLEDISFRKEIDVKYRHPGAMVKAIKENKNDEKILAHFHQVHYPYVLHPNQSVELLKYPKELRKNANPWNAYIQELNWVYHNYIEKVIDIFEDERTVIVTADHGELFGEDGLVGHYDDGHIVHELTETVPYLKI